MNKTLFLLLPSFLSFSCSNSTKEGDWYNYAPTNEKVQILKVGTINELKKYHAKEFMKDSILHLIEHSLAEIDTQKTTLGPEYQRVHDSLQALKTQYLSSRVVYNDLVSEYTQCCSFRQFNYLIILPLDELKERYGKVEK